MKNSQPCINSILQSRFLLWLSALFLVIVTLSVYAPVRHYGFINLDDGGYVYKNKHVQSGVNINSIKWAFTLIKHDEKAYWHPVTWLSHMLDCQLFKTDPGYHHLSNLFYHLINILLLFLVLFRITGERWKSAAVAALFALHPVNVDSVAWIAERKNLISSLFWFLTMLAYAHYSARPTVLRYLYVVTVFVLGLMAKPMLVTLPCALLLLDFWPLFRFKFFNERWISQTISPPNNQPTFHNASLMRLVIEKVPLLLLSFGATWLSFISLRSNGQILNEIVHPVSLRIENALISYFLYLWHMIWPFNLAIFYPFPTAIPIWQTILSALALFIITILVIGYSRKKPYLVTGWLWYIGTLTPVIGIIQGGLWPQIADRWAYIPYIGLFIILAWGAPDIFARLHRSNRYIPASLIIATLLIFSSITHHQLQYWKNTDTLFQHTLNVTKQNFFAQMQLGYSFANRNEHTQAVEYFQKALDILPDYSEAHEAMGQEYVFLKDYDKALYHYQKALLVDISNDKIFKAIGYILTNTGHYDQAIQNYMDALAINPNDSQTYNNLGSAYYSSGRLDSAMQYFKKALETQPDYPEAYYNMGLVETKKGDIEEAVKYFLKATELKKNYAEAHNSLGKAFFQTGDITKAMYHFKQVLRLLPEDASVYYNIGVILYSQKRIPEAVLHFQKALEINPEYKNAKKALQSIEVMIKKNN